MLNVSIFECWSASPTLPRVGSDEVPPADHIRDIQVVISIRRLKPRPAVVQIQPHRVFRRELVIHPVKKILLVALIVEDDKLRRIQEPPRIQPVQLKEISPVLAAVRQVETAIHSPERSVRSRKTPRRLRHTLPRPRRHLDHQRCLAAILRRRRARNHLQRLDRIRRNLVREHLALLVGNRLPVH